MTSLTYEDAEKIALQAIHDTDGRGMIGRGRNHLHQRVARALLSAARQARTQGPEEGLTPEEAWQDLLEKDDRTSPEDYPDMALITADELQAYMLAARDEGRAEGLGGWEPIETAPRDGTFVLLALRGGDFPIVGSCDTKGGEFGCARYGDAFWPQPTHWRPFPNPPPGVEKANG